jgi:hypothetical protein
MSACARSLLHAGTGEQKEHGVTTVVNFIQSCQTRPHSLTYIVTGDQCCVLHSDPVSDLISYC